MDNISCGDPLYGMYIALLCIVLVDAFSETIIIYQRKDVDQKWENHGFRLCIPDNALPHGITDCLVHIKAALSCDYTIPADNEAELVSGVYQITTTHSFMKPVTLHIQHFSSNTESLCFGINSDLKHPYKFELVDGGHFSDDSSYGFIRVKNFSLFAIFRRIRRFLQQDYRYLSSLHYSEAKLTRDGLCWKVYFVIIKDSDLYHQVHSYQVKLIFNG